MKLKEALKLAIDPIIVLTVTNEDEYELFDNEF